MGYSRAGGPGGSVGDDRAGRLVNRCPAIRQEAHRPFQRLSRFLSPKRVTSQHIFRYSAARTKEPAKIPTCGGWLRVPSGRNWVEGMRLISQIDSTRQNDVQMLNRSDQALD